MYKSLATQINPERAKEVEAILATVPEDLTFELLSDDPQNILLVQPWLDQLDALVVEWGPAVPGTDNFRDQQAMAGLLHTYRTWSFGLIREARVNERLEHVGTLGEAEQVANDLMALLWRKRLANGGSTYRDTVWHMWGIKRQPAIDLVIRDNTNLWNNGVNHGWLAKATGRGGYTLSINGVYWRQGLPSKNGRGGDTCRRVSSVAEGMAIAQSLIVSEESVGKMGVVSQM